MKLILSLIVGSIFLAGCSKEPENTLRIATAANMQYAVKEIIKYFEHEYEISCQLIIGSSGKLTAQIAEGAPYDVFLSADTKYPAELASKGLTKGNPQIYALGTIVLWTTHIKVKPDIGLLTSEKVRKIAIPNPKLAPYGRASVEVLRNMGIYDAVRDKLVFGESISQTSQFISTGAVEMGFTAKSIVLSEVMKGEGHWIDIDKQFYNPIEQAAVVLKSSKKLEEAERFYKFLFSKKSRLILTNFGYNYPE